MCIFIIHTYDNQILHHNPCFDLFIAHSNPVDTGRKLNVHKTFSLRPVPNGNLLDNKRKLK